MIFRRCTVAIEEASEEEMPTGTMFKWNPYMTMWTPVEREKKATSGLKKTTTPEKPEACPPQPKIQIAS